MTNDSSMATPRNHILSLVLVALIAQLAGCSFHEQFLPGWEQRWKHSSHAEYGGKFRAIKPPGTDDMAIQVKQRS